MEGLYNIYIRGIEYPIQVIDNIAYCDGLSANSDIEMERLLLNRLGLVKITFYHYRNCFVRDGYEVKLRPFFSKYFGEYIHYDGEGNTYYDISFTLPKDIWESAKVSLPKSILKNIINILE